MLKKIATTSLLVLCLGATSFAQDTSSVFSFSGYVDAYAAYYSDSIGMGTFQKFPTVSPRSHQLGLNVALLTAKYTAEKTRATVTLHYGDIPLSAWSASYNIIEEANAGLRLGKKLWIDAGFFRTHLGTEGLFPKENITSSVAIHTWYQPYYEAGFRFNYTPTDKLAINLYVLNGFNLYEDNNSKKSLGLLATYACTENMSIGYSGYFGDDTPAGKSVTHFRSHNNFFMNMKVKKLQLQLGGDYCLQENAGISDPKAMASMYSGVLGLKYAFTPVFSMYARGELFSDPEGFMSGVLVDNTGKNTGFKLWGATAGIEIKPTDNSYIRLEGRQLTMDKGQEIFWANGNATNARMEAMINMGISF